MSEVISKLSLRKLIDEWLLQGTSVAGPARVKPDVVAYIPLSSADQILLDASLRPVNSIKEFVFPRHEKLFGYRMSGNTVELIDPESVQSQQIVIAARPCDAAALPILDHVLNWDFRDELYNARRQRTTLITMGCTRSDESCFCTSVGLSPDSDRGSDALLCDLGDGKFEVRFVTEKARQFFAGRTEASDKIAAAPAKPAVQFDASRVSSFLEENFESSFWPENTLACVGCGVCAFTCPTCHCFDMVDEGNVNAGSRVRNWDSCQFGLFTLHASGHNPRSSQPQRQRQRLFHKFHIYPAKFGDILCTGCGNCTRHCPVGLGVLSVLSDIDHGKHL